MRKKPIVIGIIGGVSSGKSTVANFFKMLGSDVIDADEMVKGLLKRTDVKKKLVKLWGSEIIDSSGRIKKNEVAKIAFRSRGNTNKLNRIIHPMVKRMIDKKVSHSRRRMVAIDAALLLEAGYGGRCDRILFVDVPTASRYSRAVRGRGWSKGEVERRERFQMPLSKKRKIADYIINNGKSPSFTFKQVRRIYNDILKNTVSNKVYKKFL